MSNNDLTSDDIAEVHDLLVDDVDSAIASTRWKRGQSGNPGGRLPVPDDLDDLLVYRLGKQKAIALIDHLIGMAMEGSSTVNLQATMYIFNRIKGMPRQAIVQSSEGDTLIAQLLRKLVTNNATALEGHQLPAARPAVTIEQPVTSTETAVLWPDSGGAEPRPTA